MRYICSSPLQEDSKSFITLDNLDTEIEKLLNLRQDYNFAIDKQGNKISSDTTDNAGTVGFMEQQEPVKRKGWTCSSISTIQCSLKTAKETNITNQKLCVCACVCVCVRACVCEECHRTACEESWNGVGRIQVVPQMQENGRLGGDWCSECIHFASGSV